MRFNYHVSRINQPANESLGSTHYFTSAMGLVLSFLYTGMSVTVWKFKNNEWVKCRDYTPDLLDHVRSMFQ